MRRGLVFLLAIFSLIAMAIPAKQVPTNLAVVDMAGVMSVAEKNTLEGQLRKINQQGIMQAAVVIVPSTDGEDLFDYGMSIVERWQLGDNKKDNGLLLLVAIKDRKLRFFQGYGLEGDLPDIALRGVINDTIAPHFKQGAYAKGISEGMNRISVALNGEGLPLPINPEGSYENRDSDDLGLIPFVIAAAFMLARSLVRRFGKILTWIGLSSVGSILIILTLGLGLQAMIFSGLLWIGLLVVTVFAAMLPIHNTGQVRNTRQFPGGFGGRFGGGSSSGGGWSSYGGGGGGFGGGGAGGSW